MRGEAVRVSGSPQRRIVVTGSDGLIGRSVVKILLERGEDVVAIIRPGRTPRQISALRSVVQTVEVDLAHDAANVLRRVGRVKSVIHLAQAHGWHDFPRNAGEVASVSLGAAVHLAEAAVAAGADTFVLASSGGIYGPSANPLVETDPIRSAASLGFYLSAKAATEQLLVHFAPQLRVHVLRPFFVYGPGQPDAFLIPRMIRSVSEGKPIVLASGRGPRLNPVWVEDCAAAFAAATLLDAPVVANVAGPRLASLAEIVHMIGRILGRVPRIEVTEAEPDDYVASTDVMRDRLVAPTVGIEAGLVRLLSACDAPST